MLLKEKKKKGSLTMTCRSGLSEFSKKLRQPSETRPSEGRWDKACRVRGMENQGQRPFSLPLPVCHEWTGVVC